MLKQRLRNPKDVVFGTCVLTPSPSVLQPTVNANVDFVFIDTEHIALNREQISYMCKSFYFAGVTPIVRIPDHDPYKATMMIDAGAIGIVSPYVETVEQVVKLVGATKLRPIKGKKLDNILAKVQDCGSEEKQVDLYDDVVNSVIDDNNVTSNFLKEKNRDIMLFINIESTVAVENLDTLLSIPGVDGVFIGPSDLSVQLGVPRMWESKLLLDTIETIIKKTRRRNKSVGCHWSFSNAIQNQHHWVKSCGMNMVIHSSDMVLYNKTLANDLGQIKGKLKKDGGGNYLFSSAAIGSRAKLIKTEDDV